MLANSEVQAQTAAAGAEQVTLQQVDVNGGVGSDYNPRESTITRLPTPILDTPQNITIIPQKIIQDQHTSTLVEALHNVPGISFFGGEGGTHGDQVAIDGYNARNDFYRDGIRDPGWYYRDTFAVENVEVLKGPSSFLFGRGSTGGVINETTKLPKFTDFTTIEAAAYTSPGVRSTIDVNRTWSDVAARIVVLGNDTGVANRDFIYTKRVGVAPSLTMNMTPSTRVTASYIYQHDYNNPDYGIAIIPGSYFGTPYGQPAPVSANTYYGNRTPGFADYEEVQAHLFTLKGEHDINNEWKLTNSIRYSMVDLWVRVRGPQVSLTAPGYTGTNIYNSFTGGSTVGFLSGQNLNSLYVNSTNFYQYRVSNTLLTNQADLVGHFNWLNTDHTFNYGVELSRETRDQYRTSFTSSDRIDLGSPNPYLTTIPAMPATSTDTYSLGGGAGVYLGDQVKINKYLDLMAGVRYDYLKVWQSATTVSGLGQTPTAAPVNTSNKVNFVSWRAGAVVHPVENSSIFFMYGTSFDPASEYLTITNAAVGSTLPTTNETYQVGAKYDLFDHKLSLTGTLFQTTQNHALEAVDSTNGIYSEVGTTRVKGAELGIAGKVTDEWSVFGGYTYMDGRVLKSALSSTGAYVTTPGNKLQNTPRDTFTLSSTYAITPAFAIGGSAYYVTNRFLNSANTSRVPGYWRFDTMASYQLTKSFSMQLNIQNILDTKNFVSVSGFGAAQVDTGRAAIMTAKYTF